MNKTPKLDDEPSFVMPALVAGIHVFFKYHQDVDGRDEPGHDEKTEY